MRHTESAGGIVINKNGEVLVISQRGRSWSLPKGHIEAGESKIATAKREIYEESGIEDLEFVKDLGFYQRYRMAFDNSDDLSDFKTIHMFLFKTNADILKPTDPENPEARWVAKDKVAKLLTHSKDKQFFLKVINEL